MKMTREEKYMRAAIREAQKAGELGEVPIGCVIVLEDKIIGRGYNRRMVDHSALAHAEGVSKNGRLEAGGLRDVCDLGAMSHVRGSDCTGEDSKSVYWFYESQSRVCRICAESFE